MLRYSYSYQDERYPTCLVWKWDLNDITINHPLPDCQSSLSICFVAKQSPIVILMITIVIEEMLNGDGSGSRRWVLDLRIGRRMSV